MFMIFFIHLLGEGGVITKLQYTGGIKYYFVSAIVVAFYCHVNCYGLISGYLGMRSDFKYSKLLLLWCQVIFYSFGGTVLLLLFGYRSESSDLWRNSLFPIFSGTYWYVTSYFGMMILMPIVGPILKKIETKELLKLSVVLFLTFSFFPTILSVNGKFLGINQGLSLIWLLNLYIFGALLYKLDFKKLSNKKLFTVYILSICFTVVFKGYLNRDYWLTYNSPTILFSAFSIFLIFIKLNIKKEFLKQILRILSPLTLGVYLIHYQPLIYELFLKDKLYFLAEKTFFSFVFSLVGVSVSCFIICLIIDYIRLRIFEKMHVKEYCQKICKLFDE